MFKETDSSEPVSEPALSLPDRYFRFISRRGKFDGFLFKLALLTTFVSLLYFALSLNAYYTEAVPVAGGQMVEGVVGTPRFINPVLAITRADQDLTVLVFSGLLRLNKEGELEPDLAKSVTRSEDGLSYNILLKNNLRFHNGTNISADDVIYTIGLIQNADLKSPLRGAWDGVSVQKLDEYELTIRLEEAYSPFIENLTVGILPRDSWVQTPTEQIPFSNLNTEPIGSGPYKISRAVRTESGLVQAYQLTAFDNGSRPTPNIDSLVMRFYQDESQLIDDLENKRVSSTASLTPESLEALSEKRSFNIINYPLPRLFSIYFNQNRSSILRDDSVREALSLAVARHELVNTTLAGQGIPATSPIPPGFTVGRSTDEELSNKTSEELLQAARTTLEAGGWQLAEDGTWEKGAEEERVTLAIRLSTANNDPFVKTAEFVQAAWEALGVIVTVAQYEQTDLVQGVIRPRDFEAVLYGADLGRGLELYPFWHSSQKNDPGLNIAQYTNIDADALLEKIRLTPYTDTYDEMIESLRSIIESEYPAVFLFAPTITYAIDEDIDVTTIAQIARASERFASIYSWRARHDRVWPIFFNTNQN